MLLIVFLVFLVHGVFLKTTSFLIFLCCICPPHTHWQ